MIIKPSSKFITNYIHKRVFESYNALNKILELFDDNETDAKLLELREKVEYLRNQIVNLQYELRGKYGFKL